MLAKVLTFVSPLVMGGLLYAQESIQAPAVRMDPTLLAAAIVTVIAAIGGVSVQIMNASSAARDRRDAAAERKANAAAAAETGKKADVLIEKTAEIHTLTNSTNSNLQKALELMTEKFQGSERAVATLEAARKETAAVQALRDQVVSGRAVVNTPASTDEAIVQTAENTSAIKENTAKTDAAITELKEKS